MNKSVGFRPRQVSLSGSLKGNSGAFDANDNPVTPPIPAGITHGTEVVLGRFQCPKIGYPVLETLYFDGDAAGAGYLHFRVTANGQTLPYAWADSYQGITVLRDIAENLPAGALIEVRCKNEHPADDTLQAFSDGEIAVYEAQV